MKKLLSTLTFFLAFATLSAWAQPKTGDLALGGGLGFSAQLGNDNGSSTAFNFNPRGEYFLISKLAIGGSISSGFLRTTTTTLDTDTQTRRFSIGPSATYFFLEGPLQPYISSNIEIGGQTVIRQIGNLEFDPEQGTLINYRIAAGGVYWLADHFGVDASIQYNGGRFIVDGTGTDAGQLFFTGIGVRYLWSR